MDNGTYILVSGIDPELTGLYADGLILQIAGEESEEYEILDSQFADDKDNRKKYRTDKGYLYLYSTDVSEDPDIYSPAVTMFRLFKLSSFGAGMTVVINGEKISCHHGSMKTANLEAERLPIFHINNDERKELRTFCDQYRKKLSDPEWKEGITGLADFYNEAYKIENPQTAYMNLIVAAEIYRKWIDNYMDRYASLKDVIETENAMRSRGGRTSGTKRIAVLISRLIRNNGQNADEGLRKMISQLFYQRNDYVHGGKEIDDICHRMMFDTIRCMIGKMVQCKTGKDDLFGSIMKDKVPSEITDRHFSISDNDIDDLIMSFDR